MGGDLLWEFLWHLELKWQKTSFGGGEWGNETYCFAHTGLKLLGTDPPASAYYEPRTTGRCHQAQLQRALFPISGLPASPTGLHPTHLFEFPGKFSRFWCSEELGENLLEV